MSDANNESFPAGWLTLPEVAELIGTGLSGVRRLIEDSALVGSKRDGGVLRVPAAFFVDGQPLASLRGTLIALHDVGLDDDEAIDWLFAHEDSLGNAPIESLRAGRKSEVRRAARVLL